MPYFEASKSSLAEPVKLFYQDTGRGKPVIFIHGWPLNSQMWEYQMNELPARGIRCIAYDRRGFGMSDKPQDGYDYDTLASDLKALIDELNLEMVTLVGFSMGGGEVARYISRYGPDKIDKIVLVSAVTPFMLQTDDNPDGLAQETFDGFAEKIRDDRADFMVGFGKMFYGVGLLSKPVSQAYLDWNQAVVMHSSSRATLECLKSFSTTDFRSDLRKINIDTLIIHGDSDKTVPIDASGRKTAAILPSATFKIYSGEPHGLFYTQKETFNEDLISFIIGGRSGSELLAEDRDFDTASDTMFSPSRSPNAGIL